MKYSEHLKKVFPDTNLHVEDLLLLESFQVKYLIERVPQKEFAALLRVYPNIHRYLLKKEPTINSFLEKVLSENKRIDDQEIIEEYCDEVIWEIGELLIYNKYPETYDSKITFTWEINDIISPELLNGKIAADVGAGTGALSYLLSKYAKTVYAIEPLGSFRKFMGEKVNSKKIENITIIDGFLENIPLQDNSLDFLFTSNALGWNFDKEQQEIQRVLKQGGQAIHLMRAFDKDATSPYHDKLLKYNYELRQLEAESFKAKYIKTIV